MSVLRKLAGQTAIYGLSSIVARFLNFLLTPLYTSKGVFPPAEFGVMTSLYAWGALHQHRAHLRHGDRVLPLCQQGHRR
ncbi:MAG: hypothetical protein IPP33_09790 [Flavobacteriales bacterium]|nr:hypothetical protein [Flavobacteriales bacterium]